MRAQEELANEIRQLLDLASNLNGSEEAVRAAIKQAQILRTQMAAMQGRKPIPRYGAPVNGDINPVLPFSPISGQYNPLAIPLHYETDVDGDGNARLVATCTFGAAYEGPPGCVHGGFVSAVYDEILAMATILCDQGGPTARLSIQYHAPTPLMEELRFIAKPSETRGRIVKTIAECWQGDTKVTSAEGTFVELSKDRQRNHWRNEADQLDDHPLAAKPDP